MFVKVITTTALLVTAALVFDGQFVWIPQRLGNVVESIERASRILEN